VWFTAENELTLVLCLQYKYKVDDTWRTSPCEAITTDGKVRPPWFSVSCSQVRLRQDHSRTHQNTETKSLIDKGRDNRRGDRPKKTTCFELSVGVTSLFLMFCMLVQETPIMNHGGPLLIWCSTKARTTPSIRQCGASEGTDRHGGLDAACAFGYARCTLLLTWCRSRGWLVLLTGAAELTL
jgi:hypothetical protein